MDNYLKYVTYRTRKEWDLYYYRKALSLAHRAVWNFSWEIWMYADALVFYIGRYDHL